MTLSRSPCSSCASPWSCAVPSPRVDARPRDAAGPNPVPSRDSQLSPAFSSRSTRGARTRAMRQRPCLGAAWPRRRPGQPMWPDPPTAPPPAPGAAYYSHFVEDSMRRLTFVIGILVAALAVAAASAYAQAQPRKASTKATATATAPVNLNSAALAQLETLPGIGAAAANRIVGDPP